MANLIEQNSFDGEDGTWEMARALPHAALRHDVVSYAGYRESTSKPIWRREVPSAIIPLIINFGASFHLRDGKTAGGSYLSFAAGLYSGPVIVGSAGSAYCMQVNFSPLGALRFFHLPQSDIAGRTVSLEDILGAEGRNLACQLHDATGWSARFALLERFIAERFARAHNARAAAIEAWHGLASQHGRVAIHEIAQKIGVSRRHLAKLCLSELGMTPKALARILRFDYARKLSRTVPRAGWADLAYEAGYADQAHLVREFRSLSGLTPSELLRRDRVETGIIEPGPH